MTTTSNHYVTVLWEARAKPGKEAAMKAFMTAAVTASRYDAGNISALSRYSRSARSCVRHG
ncbi:monooxygenase [Streptomyces sp. PRh5]|uniref:hypothetical protein n=1 Tax=Streptomyces sp. PRh5 TaxID=1158056 RepID=UPI00044948E1|nr:hypothetical protein [Streptomyces sp. PRh5]EXU62339.1 monooxygenase [Streptomyces sp. PRh5]